MFVSNLCRLNRLVMLLKQHRSQRKRKDKKVSLIEFIHNLVHFCVGHMASLQLAAVVDGLQNNTVEVAITDRRQERQI